MLAPALLPDNVLKTACDLVIVMVCALELAYTSAGGKDGASAGRYTVFFAVAMVGVLASCAFALVVKICRLVVHTGSTSCAPLTLPLRPPRPRQPAATPAAALVAAPAPAAASVAVVAAAAALAAPVAAALAGAAGC